MPTSNTRLRPEENVDSYGCNAACKTYGSHSHCQLECVGSSFTSLGAPVCACKVSKEDPELSTARNMFGHLPRLFRVNHGRSNGTFEARKSTEAGVQAHSSTLADRATVKSATNKRVDLWRGALS